MNLSKVIVSGEVVRKLKLGYDDYAIHRLVYKIVDKDTRPLFSSTSVDGSLVIFIKHSVEIKPIEGVSIMTKKYVVPSNGALVSFDLIANPTRKFTTNSGKKVIKVVDDIEKWFLNKEIGLDIQSLEIESQNPINIKNKVNVPVFRYSGRATVTDSDLLTRVINTGIGREKAFGCGMIKIW